MPVLLATSSVSLTFWKFDSLFNQQEFVLHTFITLDLDHVIMITYCNTRENMYVPIREKI